MAVTIAPATAAPASSWTSPSIVPEGSEATRSTGWGVCAEPRADAQRTTTAPTPAAINLDASLMVPPSGRGTRGGALPGGDGEVDFPRQRLVRDLVGHLDLEAVITVREGGKRYGLAGL